MSVLIFIYLLNPFTAWLFLLWGLWAVNLCFISHASTKQLSDPGQVRWPLCALFLTSGQRRGVMHPAFSHMGKEEGQIRTVYYYWWLIFCSELNQAEEQLEKSFGTLPHPREQRFCSLPQAQATLLSYGSFELSLPLYAQKRIALRRYCTGQSEGCFLWGVSFLIIGTKYLICSTAKPWSIDSAEFWPFIRPLPVLIQWPVQVCEDQTCLI